MLSTFFLDGQINVVRSISCNFHVFCCFVYFNSVYFHVFSRCMNFNSTCCFIFFCSDSYLLLTVITSETSLFSSDVCLEDIYFRFNLYSVHATTNTVKTIVVAIMTETVSMLAEKESMFELLILLFIHFI